jgi:hypothetical protein
MRPKLDFNIDRCTRFILNFEWHALEHSSKSRIGREPKLHCLRSGLTTSFNEGGQIANLLLQARLGREKNAE